MKSRALLDETMALAMDAVERLLIRVGYDRMSMEDVAHEAGIETRALLLCFRNKGDLLLAREDRIARSVKEAMQRMARRSGSWDERIREMLYLRVMFRFEAMQHLPESIDEILRDIRPELREREEIYCQEESKILGGVLQRGRKIATLQPQACLILATALVTATNSLLPFHLTSNDLRRRSVIEEKTSQVIKLVLHGLPGKHRLGNECAGHQSRVANLLAAG
jgi:AcrR family transcriptional regulator